MFRKTFLILALAAGPAWTQQPAAASAKPAQAPADTTKAARAHRRAHRTTTHATKPAARTAHHDTTAHRDSVKP
jgi:hypothetical protein